MKTLIKKTVITTLAITLFTSLNSYAQQEAPAPLTGLPTQQELSAWTKNINKMGKKERG